MNGLLYWKWTNYYLDYNSRIGENKTLKSVRNQNKNSNNKKPILDEEATAAPEEEEVMETEAKVEQDIVE